MIFPPFWQRATLVNAYIPVAIKSKYIRKILLNETRGRTTDGEQAVYFSHDVSADRTSQALMRALPIASRVCYGDPPGFLNQEEKARHQTFVTTLREYFLFSIFSVQSNTARAIDLRQDINITPFPLDLGHEDHHSQETEVVPTHIFREVVLQVAASLYKLQRGEIARMRRSLAGNRHMTLLICGNFFESGLISLDAEIRLYRDALVKHEGRNSSVTIKLHPGSGRRKIKKIRELMMHFPNSILIEDLASKIPIECLLVYMGNVNIISFSSASIPLRYAMYLTVCHALDDQAVVTRFNESAQSNFRRANLLVLEAMREVKK